MAGAVQIGQILEVRRPNVAVERIEEGNYYSEKDLIQNGISSEQAKDIVEHPDQIRIVYLGFDLYNNSVWASASDIQIEAHLPEEAKKRLVWMEDNISFPYVGTKEEHPDGVIAFYKLRKGTRKKI